MIGGSSRIGIVNADPQFRPGIGSQDDVARPEKYGPRTSTKCVNSPNRIIAGRPYLSKAHLVTHNVIPALTYQGLRQLVVAKQKDSKFAKDVKSKK